MEYFPNLPSAFFAQPQAWAKAKEAQGWHGICASDHILVGTNPYPHVFVTAAALATATENITITTSFANNLFRSPVEFAQAALTLQILSNHRFEAGLGAGWAEHEMHALGLEYPPPKDRVSRYIEALEICRALLHTGQCQFQGAHYQIDIRDEFALGPLPDTPPPLVASAGGPRAIREATPLVDRVEIKASASSTRGGSLDIPKMAEVTRDDVASRVDRVKAIDPDKPVSIFILIGVGEGPDVQQLSATMGGGYLAGFVGPADAVAAQLEDLATMGISRAQLTELIPGSQDALAPHLL